MGWARFNHWISKCARGSLAQRTRLSGPGWKRRHFKLSWLLWNRCCFAFQALTLCTQSAQLDQYPRRRERRVEGERERMKSRHLYFTQACVCLVTAAVCTHACTLGRLSHTHAESVQQKNEKPSRLTRTSDHNEGMFMCVYVLLYDMTTCKLLVVLAAIKSSHSPCSVHEAKKEWPANK